MFKKEKEKVMKIYFVTFFFYSCLFDCIDVPKEKKSYMLRLFIKSSCLIIIRENIFFSFVLSCNQRITCYNNLFGMIINNDNVGNNICTYFIGSKRVFSLPISYISKRKENSDFYLNIIISYFHIHLCHIILG